MAFTDMDDTTTWEPIPGWALFALLLTVASIFVLFPVGSASSLPHRLTRISPFGCLYDILHRGLEIGFLLHDRWHSDREEYSLDVLIQLHGTGSWIGLATRIVAAVSLVFLFTLRNAFWTHIFAGVYITHGILVNNITIRRSEDAARSRTIHRQASVAFAILCHHALLVATSERPKTQVAIFIDGIVSGLVAVSAYFFSEDADRDHGLWAVAGQVCLLGFLSFTWLLAFSPVVLEREPLPSDATEWHYLVKRFHPALNGHFGVVCFFLSRRSLELAHPGVKLVVATVWLGLGAVAYCWLYDVYTVIGLPVAERMVLPSERDS